MESASVISTLRLRQPPLHYFAISHHCGHRSVGGFEHREQFVGIDGP